MIQMPSPCHDILEEMARVGQTASTTVIATLVALMRKEYPEVSGFREYTENFDLDFLHLDKTNLSGHVHFNDVIPLGTSTRHSDQKNMLMCDSLAKPLT